MQCFCIQKREISLNHLSVRHSLSSCFHSSVHSTAGIVGEDGLFSDIARPKSVTMIGTDPECVGFDMGSESHAMFLFSETRDQSRSCPRQEQSVILSSFISPFGSGCIRDKQCKCKCRWEGETGWMGVARGCMGVGQISSAAQLKVCVCVCLHG